MNRWNIPVGLEREVLARDRACVYCGIVFALSPATRGALPSWEHIVNDAQIVTRQNIARCCMSCNASKGTKELRRWLSSIYCRRKGISESTVARVVQEALSTSGASPELGYPK
jgi:5-methylcytosine-specific restriction endonuclease McrA